MIKLEEVSQLSGDDVGFLPARCRIEGISLLLLYQISLKGKAS